MCWHTETPLDDLTGLKDMCTWINLIQLNKLHLQIDFYRQYELQNHHDIHEHISAMWFHRDMLLLE